MIVMKNGTGVWFASPPEAGRFLAQRAAKQEETMTRCLVVDDDAEIRHAVSDYLGRFGMEVSTAADGVEMRRAMGSGQVFDVIVLDLMLPDESGLSLCQWVQQNSQTPVVMLTAQGDPVSRVLGLEMGADDYLPKPFEPRELVARINAVLRRTKKGERGMEPSKSRSVQFEGWKFDRVLRQLRSPEEVVVVLSNAEFRLLSAFVDRPGRVMTRDQLIDLTRAPGVVVNDRSIDLSVSRLRQKLGDSSREPRMIRTMRGEGYLFDCQVSG
ncbi:response regulator [Pelomonas sp. KK5]|uniref:response regulator n=1 Tax=Pelomonas sp. KK5 TaxID=1855730 RepID=UPI003519BC13